MGINSFTNVHNLNNVTASNCIDSLTTQDVSSTQVEGTETAVASAEFYPVLTLSDPVPISSTQESIVDDACAEIKALDISLEKNLSFSETKNSINLTDDNTLLLLCSPAPAVAAEPSSLENVCVPVKIYCPTTAGSHHQRRTFGDNLTNSPKGNSPHRFAKAGAGSAFGDISSSLPKSPINSPRVKSHRSQRVRVNVPDPSFFVLSDVS